ncbi:MAG: hypothetical protein U1G05_16760 [Kiritimatiellia bacterium]
MNLRKAAAYACALQFVQLLAGLYNYLRLLNKLDWEDNSEFLIIQPIWLLANAATVLFFFILQDELGSWGLPCT